MDATDSPHRKVPHVYAVVRFDHFMSKGELENCATVVKIFPSRDTAAMEAKRLTRLQEGKECTYVSRSQGWPALR